MGVRYVARLALRRSMSRSRVPSTVVVADEHLRVRRNVHSDERRPPDLLVGKVQLAVKALGDGAHERPVHRRFVVPCRAQQLCAARPLDPRPRAELLRRELKKHRCIFLLAQRVHIAVSRVEVVPNHHVGPRDAEHLRDGRALGGAFQKYVGWPEILGFVVGDRAVEAQLVVDPVADPFPLAGFDVRNFDVLEQAKVTAHRAASLPHFQARRVAVRRKALVAGTKPIVSMRERGVL